MNELDEQAIRNYWRKSSILPLDWNVDINNLNEHVKAKMEDEAIELGKLNQALNLGNDIYGRQLPKNFALEFVNIQGEDDSKVEYSIDQFMQLVQESQ